MEIQLDTLLEIMDRAAETGERVKSTFKKMVLDGELRTKQVTDVMTHYNPDMNVAQNVLDWRIVGPDEYGLSMTFNYHRH